MSTKKTVKKNTATPGVYINTGFNKKAFAADIIATRERLDVSQAEAAKIASKGGTKISQVTIYDAELNGSCSLRTLPGICNFIGNPVQHYFTKP